jgi:pimeloyl-ACP methyl ester carboxylesterase
MGMQRISLPGLDLSGVPELTNEALEFARWNPEVGCLIDRVYPGRPLIVCFSFVDWHNLPIFDFFGRTKKLEKRFGITMNRVLVRDPKNAWYHRGVPGLGTHVDEVTGTLRSLIRSIRPGRLITIGQSMGGYAAIMFGILLNADRIVSFGPLSHLDAREAVRYGDLRFLSVMELLQLDPPKSAYLDLPKLAGALDYQGSLHVVYGTHPGNDDGVSGNLDAMHAFRLAKLPHVMLHPYPESEHRIGEWLTRHQQMDDLLARLLLEEEDRIRTGEVLVAAGSS